MRTPFDMSDEEINLAVSQIDPFNMVTELRGMPYEVVCLRKPGPCRDYLTTWTHAGPLIERFFISLENDDMFENPKKGSFWKAHNTKGNHCHDQNPLRAAMIVLLMQKEW